MTLPKESPGRRKKRLRGAEAYAKGYGAGRVCDASSTSR